MANPPSLEVDSNSPELIATRNFQYSPQKIVEVRGGISEKVLKLSHHETSSIQHAKEEEEGDAYGVSCMQLTQEQIVGGSRGSPENSGRKAENGMILSHKNPDFQYSNSGRNELIATKLRRNGIRYTCRRVEKIIRVPIDLFAILEERAAQIGLSFNEYALDVLAKDAGIEQGLATYTTELQKLRAKVEELEGGQLIATHRVDSNSAVDSNSKELIATPKYEPKTHCDCGNPIDRSKFNSHSYCSEECFQAGNAKRKAAKAAENALVGQDKREF